MSFVHLHTHSHYSLLDGLGNVPALVAAAKKHKMSALALTDHGVLYGAIEFYQECLKHGVKPIIGVEAYLTDGSMTDQDRSIKPYHLILLATSAVGYHNLLFLTTEAHLTGFYYKPRFDWETLKKHREGLIALTGCLNGPLARPILARDEKKLEANIARLVDIFTTDNLYLELQHRPTMPEQSTVNERLKRLSQTSGIPLVATNDIHYIDTEDASAHDVLLCLQTKSHLSDKNRMSYLGENYSLLSAAEMAENFRDAPEALVNTERIAERCNVEITLGKINLPYFETPDGKSGDRYLQELADAGVLRRYGCTTADAPRELRERLSYELDVIRKTGFADYFLIVQDFVNWARTNGIMVGPGRGSAAGSLVSYLIGITNIDPLHYELLFERFLNPERISMPDIDMDFADTGRDKVLKYVEEKYGKDRVAQIITFGTMAARAAVRDVGRVMGLSYGYCDRVAKMIPPFASLDEALQKIDEVKTLYAEDAEARRLLDLARSVEGVARHTSTHACAVIITKDPLVQHVPLQFSSSDPDTIISQYSMYPVDALGLLKIDFLGLKNLTILQTAVEIIEATTGTAVDLEHLPLDDPESFRLLQHGDTTGIFQLESDGMTRYLKKLRPNTIEDIIAMVSLYRPGPMEFIDDYIAGKQGRRTPKYLHPMLEKILKKTYGIAVYQEQVLQIARDLAGFTYGEADILRKAVGKKIKKLLVEQSEKMIKGMIANGIEQRTAEKIWEFILPFARYGFNRSHAASYALIAYQTAYLKSHYPTQFMAALMTADLDNADKIVKQVHESEKMGLVILPPDVNESFSTFSVIIDPATQKITNKIRFGLNAIKNVGEHISKEIIHERKKNGRFESLENFLSRIQDKDLNKKSLESLVKAGALDSLADRATLIGNIEAMLQFNKKIQEQVKRGQEDLFADLPLAHKHMKLKFDPAPALTTMQKLILEKELLGLYISDHPFKKYHALLTDTVNIASITVDGAVKDANHLMLAGIITAVQKIITKSGKPMLFVTIEDSTGTVELLVFPRLMEQYPSLWHENTLVRVTGRLSDKDGVPKILVESAEPLSEQRLTELRASNGAHQKLWLNLPHACTKDDLRQVKHLLEQYPGSTPVYLIMSNGSERKIKTTIRITPNEDLEQTLTRLLGKNSVQLQQ
ncbi:MAG: DNA polymerase III subunit alpha [Candidatus Komeilibacteria bacterium RIFCSPLOWO2_01_FULL_53_11]|uniref:DNA polymerase III subunit alpha n=1 Tax=Candidatus Komeilibacteria bacterium RIFCSPLOWO2_01_FULL_53_11 TaxID=1798552 RepID=A0A1G2BUY7_9BACT|nr:MAG: DNA polymerase III subunit alpha [Candidatus Komeilibacteria bacterium RIFCSPLOWO2_01_FULL_53_11]